MLIYATVDFVTGIVFCNTLQRISLCCGCQMTNLSWFSVLPFIKQESLANANVKRATAVHVCIKAAIEEI